MSFVVRTTLQAERETVRGLAMAVCGLQPSGVIDRPDLPDTKTVWFPGKGWVVVVVPGPDLPSPSPGKVLYK